MTETKRTSQPAMWKVPPRREYKPKAMDPGQRVTWHVRVDGHYAGPAALREWRVPRRYRMGRRHRVHPGGHGVVGGHVGIRLVGSAR